MRLRGDHQPRRAFAGRPRHLKNVIDINQCERLPDFEHAPADRPCWRAIAHAEYGWGQLVTQLAAGGPDLVQGPAINDNVPNGSSRIDLGDPAVIPNRLAAGMCCQPRARTFAKIDPATGREICRVARSSAADVRAAPSTRAKRAQPAWAATTVVKRGDILAASRS